MSFVQALLSCTNVGDVWELVVDSLPATASLPQAQVVVKVRAPARINTEGRLVCSNMDNTKSVALFLYIQQQYGGANNAVEIVSSDSSMIFQWIAAASSYFDADNNGKISIPQFLGQPAHPLIIFCVYKSWNLMITPSLYRSLSTHLKILPVEMTGCKSRALALFALCCIYSGGLFAPSAVIFDKGPVFLAAAGQFIDYTQGDTEVERKRCIHLVTAPNPAQPTTVEINKAAVRMYVSMFFLQANIGSNKNLFDEGFAAIIHSSTTQNLRSSARHVDDKIRELTQASYIGDSKSLPGEDVVYLMAEKVALEFLRTEIAIHGQPESHIAMGNHVLARPKKSIREPMPAMMIAANTFIVAKTMQIIIGSCQCPGRHLTAYMCLAFGVKCGVNCACFYAIDAQRRPTDPIARYTEEQLRVICGDRVNNHMEIGFKYADDAEAAAVNDGDDADGSDGDDDDDDDDDDIENNDDDNDDDDAEGGDNEDIAAGGGDDDDDEPNDPST